MSAQCASPGGKRRDQITAITNSQGIPEGFSNYCNANFYKSNTTEKCRKIRISFYLQLNNMVE